MNFKYSLSLTIIFCLTTTLNSQVKNIKKEIETDNKESDRYSSYSSHSYDNSDNDLAFIAEIAYGIAKGVSFITYEAQKEVLKQRDNYPNIISFETKLDYGTNFHKITFTPSARINWGILASDIRYNLLHDNTGNLSSLDWQVLILRIPTKYIGIHYGIGFTSIRDPKESYLESSTGFDISTIQNKLNIDFNYRWTEKKEIRSRYRQEVKINAGFLTMHTKNLYLYPNIGYTYLQYYKRHKYGLVNAGIKIRFSRH